MIKKLLTVSPQSLLMMVSTFSANFIFEDNILILNIFFWTSIFCGAEKWRVLPQKGKSFSHETFRAIYGHIKMAFSQQEYLLVEH